MFKILKDNKIIGISETTPVLLDNYEVIEVDESINDYTQVEGEYLLNTNERVISFKQDYVRSVRNQLLKNEVDSLVCNPLRYADMNEEEKQSIADYRHYLLDYTQTDNWYKTEPKTYLEFIGE